MSAIKNIASKMRSSLKDIGLNDLKKVCEYYFGALRQSGSSHCVFKTPWLGDPRVNIQNQKEKAKPYQVKQVLLAIEKLEINHDS
ncbi:MAG: toxin HicA [Gammaproteobacteria bacterium]|nr:toxin HicA [Gammaproteobacteria bacterium]